MKKERLKLINGWVFNPASSLSEAEDGCFGEGKSQPLEVFDWTNRSLPYNLCLQDFGAVIISHDKD
jgi:hypothetical protein